MENFINPNWHVIFIHFPLGVFLTGVLVEIISLFWRNRQIRIAGIWMVGIGGLLAIVTAVSGIYAFRDILMQEFDHPDFSWQALASNSDWTADQWRYISRHILLNAIGTATIAAAVFFWIIFSGRFARQLFAPFLLAAIIAAGLFTAAGWYGGELVYKFGVGVLQTDHSTVIDRGLEYFISPMQFHIVMAGLAAVSAFVALSLTFRTWIDNPAHTDFSANKFSDAPAAAWLFWILALLFGLVTAVAGFGMVWGGLNPDAIKANIELLGQLSFRRLALHLFSGVILLLSIILMMVLGGSSLRRRNAKFVFGMFIVLAVAVQVWLGTMILFDTAAGPLFSFGSDFTQSADN